MTGRVAAIAAAIEPALGPSDAPLRLRPVGGGSINAAATFDSHGRTWFVKWNDHALPRQFEAEAAGLTAMRGSGAALVVPAPVAFSDAGPGRSFLVMEHVAAGPRGETFDEGLGRALAAMHGVTSARGFGFPLDGACGATPQANGWMERWVDFYRERRLAPQLAFARARGLSAADQRRGDRLLDRLELLLGDDEPAALIHGDLWSGNLLSTADGRPALIDPAASFSHREAELGMMVLFGGFSPRVFDAYHEARPLREGWPERLDLYSLYHVLNHYHLFGGGYGDDAMRIVARYV